MATAIERFFGNKYVQLAALAAGALALSRSWKKSGVSGIGDLTSWNKRHLQNFFERAMYGGLVTLYIAYEDERGYIPVGFTYGGHNYEGSMCLISPNNIDYLKELCDTYKCYLKQVDIYPGYIPGVRRKIQPERF